MEENISYIRWRGVFLFVHRCLDALARLGGDFLPVGFVPKLLRRHIFYEPVDRIFVLPFSNFLCAAIAAGIIGGGFIAVPKGNRFNERRALARARPLERLVGGAVDREDIVAVDLNTQKTVGDRFLR